MKHPKPTLTSPPAAIHRDELVSLAELQSRFKLGYKGTAALRKAGLPIKYFGRKGFVLGSDFLDFFAALPSDLESARSSDSRQVFSNN